MAPSLLDARLAEKYSRLMLVKDIGPTGFLKIRKLRAAVVGCGATGSHIVDMLARLGVGYIRVIDGDFVDISNIYRMSLVTEEDAEKAMPKAVACAERARIVNRDVKVEAVVDKLEAANALELIDGVDVVFDGTDNFRTRLLINEVAVAKGIPWIYVGVEGWYANVMLIEPGKGACLHCFISRPPRREEANVCDIIGVFPSTIAMASSIAVAIAIRHLLGLEDHSSKLYIIDGTEMRIEVVDIKRRHDCPVCVHRRFTFTAGTRPTSWIIRPVCGTNAIEVKPPMHLEVDLNRLAKLHERQLEAANPYLVRLRIGELAVVVFKDGRAIVEGTVDTSKALSAYRSVLEPLGINPRVET